MCFIRVVVFSLIYFLSCSIFGSELEEILKKAPHSERPSLLIEIADEKFEDLKQISNNILRLREIFHETLIGERQRKQHEKDEELRESFDNIFKMFNDFRSKVSICTSVDVEKSFYDYSLFAQAYYDFTELFVQFVKEDLFPRDWQYLNFDELQKNGTIENRNLMPDSGASSEK